MDSSKSLKTVKVKGRESDASSTSKLTIEIPGREADVVVPEARNPLSTIVHVMRLTRPFTLPQLKSMLGKFGEMKDDEFWIDEIKSQCYVKVSHIFHLR